MSSEQTPQISVATEADQIVIRIPFGHLPHAASCHDDYYDSDGESLLTVTNEGVFAAEVVKALKDEREDGTTWIDAMLEEAIGYAVEDGGRGVEIREESELDDDDGDL